MKDEEINRAIAEHCGWVWYRIPNSRLNDRIYRCLFLPAIHEYEGQSPVWLVRADGSERICNAEFMYREAHLPNYCNDLNAMHEAESALEGYRWACYLKQLWRLVNPQWEISPVHPLNYLTKNMVFATARQRAEAFLRAIGKWQESPVEKE